GLSAGDQVIVEGLQKVRPGAEVTAAPAGPSPTEAGSEAVPAHVQAAGPAGAAKPSPAEAGSEAANVQAAGPAGEVKPSPAANGEAPEGHGADPAPAAEPSNRP